MRMIKWEAPLRAEGMSSGLLPHRDLRAVLKGWEEHALAFMQVCKCPSVMYAVKHYSKRGTLVKVTLAILPATENVLEKYRRPGDYTYMLVNQQLT